MRRSELAEALTIATRVVPTKTASPILECVKIGDSIEATDTEVGVRVALDCECAPVCVPAERLLAVVRSMDCDTVTIERAGDHVKVTGGGSVFTLACRDASDFPRAGAGFYESVQLHTLSAAVLKRGLDLVRFATDEASTRYALGAIEYRAGTLAATDTRRLSVVKLTDAGPTVLMPAKTIKALLPLLSEEVTLQVSDGGAQMQFQVGAVTLWSMSVQGRFPDWQRVMPSPSHIVAMPSEGLATALRQAIVTTAEESRGVDFRFAMGELTITSRAADVGESKVVVPCEWPRAELKIVLDPKYLLDWLKLQVGTVSVGLTGPSDAMLLSTDESRYVVMPLSAEA